jgi:hypothetical protein
MKHSSTQMSVSSLYYFTNVEIQWVILLPYFM